MLLFFTPSRVNVNIWCLGLLWLDKHSHSQLQTVSPSYGCSQIRLCNFAWTLNLILATAAHSPPAAGREPHVYTSAAIKPKSSREVPRTVTKVQGSKLKFSASAPPPISSPSYLSWRIWNQRPGRGEGRNTRKRITKGSHLLALTVYPCPNVLRPLHFHLPFWTFFTNWILFSKLASEKFLPCWNHFQS